MRRPIPELLLRRLRERQAGNRARRAVAVVGAGADGAAALVEILGAVESRGHDFGQPIACRTRPTFGWSRTASKCARLSS